MVVNVFMQVGLMAIIIVGGMILFAIGVIRRDVDFIKRHPFVFAMETLIVAIVPALTMFVFAVSRGISWILALQWFYGLAAKFGVFHVLFQVSGFYAYMFS